mmetsp:Transcript_2251/g.2498  ORF Transcript_2251/g.2498 Transcript_2251/m.2498 type:complete len:125 (+) Transcript_2251:2-376(+)
MAGGGTTVTNKLRTKRPDLRPNARQRKKDVKAKYNAPSTVPTYASKKLTTIKKERKFDNQGMKLNKGDDSVKKVKALSKKLKQLDELLERQNEGQRLDEQQLAKLETREELIEQLQAFATGEAA